jgi:CheY-like chemotaxis protein
MYLKGKHIFIVEDNLANSTIMRLILEAAGAKVSCDRLGVNTPTRMREVGMVDLVILDLMLSGGVSGYEVYEKLRSDPLLKQVPVIVVSASDPALEMNRARQQGLRGYITKPIDNYTFARHIADILQGRQVWGDD